MDTIGYYFFRLLYAIFRRIPTSVLATLLHFLALIAYATGLRRRVVTANLRIMFGDEITDDELRSTTKKCYLFAGENLAFIFKAESFLSKHPDRIVYRGLSFLERRNENEPGTILLSGHLGNFILAAYAIVKKGYHHHIVGKVTKNEAFNRFIAYLYGKFGYGAIFVKGFKDDARGAVKIFRNLKKGEIITIQNDQDAGREGYQTNFLGIRTSIPHGPGRFAYKTRAQVVTGFTYNEKGKTIVEIQPPIDYSGATSIEEAEKIVLDEYSRRLETLVRKYPEQYFWFHKKWKTNPNVSHLYGAGK